MMSSYKQLLTIDKNSYRIKLWPPEGVGCVKEKSVYLIITIQTVSESQRIWTMNLITFLENDPCHGPCPPDCIIENPTSTPCIPPCPPPTCEIGCGPSSCGPSSCGPSSCGPSSCGPSSCGPSSCGPSSCGPSSCGPSSCGPSSCGPF